MKKLISLIIASLLIITTAFLPPVPIPVAIAQINAPKLDIGFSEGFYQNHVVSGENDVKTKAITRVDGGKVLHYIPKGTADSLKHDLSRRFANLQPPNYPTPAPDIAPNNYCTANAYQIWEVSRKNNPTKPTVQEIRALICYGVQRGAITPRSNKLPLTINHLQSVTKVGK